MKEVVNVLAGFVICGSYFTFGYWTANNKDAPIEPRVLYGVATGVISGAGFWIKKENEK